MQATRRGGRTRTYLGDPDDPWDEKDKKRWFVGPVQASTDDEAVMKARDHMVQMSIGFVVNFGITEPPKLFELVRGANTVERFAEVLKSMPWAHSMQATTH